MDRKGSDCYCALATSMFGYEVTKKNKKERGGGKVGILACGFQGGPNAVRRMADGMGIDLDASGIDPQFVVDGFRNKYPRVVRLWHDCESAFRLVMSSTRTDTMVVGYFRFHRIGNAVIDEGDRCTVRLYLPSGRYLTYMNARFSHDPRGGDKKVITYDVAVNGNPCPRTTYGGKIVENGVQAFCRDLMADAMLRIDARGWDIAFHVHDEIICEVPDALAETCVAEVREIMHTPPPWAEGMFCASEPEIAKRYKK
jgi:DNA polymerase